jgi:hypothetical protein
LNNQIKELSMKRKKSVPIIGIVIFIVFFTGCEKKAEKRAELSSPPPIKETEETMVKTPPLIKPSQEQQVTKEDDGAFVKKEPVVPVKEETKEKSQEQEAVVSEKAPDGKKTIGVSYAGVKKCKTCHLKQYKSWAETNMATSFENLESGVKAEAKSKAGLDPQKDYTHDTGCLKCHTTGYGRPGGFVSIEDTPHLANVQCEGCHGPGSEYSKLMKKNKKFPLADAKAAGLIIPSEDKEGCLGCHGKESPFNESVDPKYAFQFKQRLEKTHKHFPLKYEH